MRPVVIVLVKEPRPGRVKTRLAQGIGTIRATWWFRHQLRGLLRRIGRDPRWDVVLSVAPDTALYSPMLPSEFPQIAQGGGDLGIRMLRALAAFEGRPALLIGADIPDVDRNVLAAGFAALRRGRVAFGPSEDGGYWMIGRGAGVRLGLDDLAGVRWSNPQTLADSRRCFEARHKIALGPRLRDVDDASDL